jgi:threonine aldolase
MIDPHSVAERLRDASRDCERVFGPARTTPAEDFRALAEACDALGIDRHDRYGADGPVVRLETEVAALLGKPAAAFFPSGVMAQQSVLRAWCERRGSLRVAIPDLSHLLVHEDDGPRLLHGFRFEHLTVGRRVATAADLAALGPGLGAALVELPLRDAGCLLPTWDELVELSATARSAGVPLHADGARIWESQEHFGRSLVEVAGLVDSMYVSFYKGLGGLSGACVAGPDDVIAAARTWRRRMGGTLFHLSPYAVSALVGLRDRLPRMAAYVSWARELADALAAQGFRVSPAPPQTNTFVVYSEGDPDALNTRLLAHVEDERLAVWPAWSASSVPGWCQAEVVAGEAALRHGVVTVAETVARLVAEGGGRVG